MMKDVGCFEGVFNIRIPINWVEEKEDDGGILFYAESPDSGTLRVNFLTLESPKDMDQDAPKELLSLRAAKYGTEIISLEDGRAMVSYNSLPKKMGSH